MSIQSDFQWPADVKIGDKVNVPVATEKGEPIYYCITVINIIDSSKGRMIVGRMPIKPIEISTSS